MREQMEALRPQYEAAARAIEHVHFMALNDSVEQSRATSYGTDLAEAARASIGNITANIEAALAHVSANVTR